MVQHPFDEPSDGDISEGQFLVPALLFIAFCAGGLGGFLTLHRSAPSAGPVATVNPKMEGNCP
jgi:hypothetical protein